MSGVEEDLHKLGPAQAVPELCVRTKDRLGAGLLERGRPFGAYRGFSTPTHGQKPTLE